MGSNSDSVTIVKRLFGRTVNMFARLENTSTLDYFLLLFEEAKKDFPALGLSPQKIVVLKKTEEWGTFDGIMFEVPEEVEIPKEYQK